MFERVDWLEDGLDRLGSGAAADLVRECLEIEEIAGYFRRRAGLEVMLEQAVEVIQGGRWMSGVIDRLLVQRDDSGRVESATVVDFKSDRVEAESELIERYSGQMQDYRQAVAAVLELGPGEVDCVLVSTALKRVVKICVE